VQPTLVNILGRILLVSGATSGTFLVSERRNFPECIVKLSSQEARWKINHKQCKLAAIFVFSSNTCITHNAHFLIYMFYAEFIMQIPGKCRLCNFYHLILLKISKLIKLLLKNIYLSVFDNNVSVDYAKETLIALTHSILHWSSSVTKYTDDISGRCRTYLERSAAARRVCTLAACFS